MTSLLNRPEATVTRQTPATVCPACHRDHAANSTVICRDCATQLAADLTALHTGPILRTRTHVVAYYVDRPPLTRKVVDYAPGLLADLDDTIARLTKTGSGGMSTVSPLAESPLIFNARASEEAAVARDVLSRWVNRLLRPGVPLHLPGHAGKRLTAPLAAEWLANQAGHLAMLPDAALLAADIAGIVRRIRQLVDRAPDLTYVGPCDRELVDGDTTRECGRDLYGHLDKPTVRCPGCGTDYQLSQRRDWLLLRVGEQLATITEVTRALPTLLGETVASSTIRTWVHQGRLTQHPGRRRDQPVYKVRDVIDLAAAAMRAKRERAERRAQQENQTTN